MKYILNNPDYKLSPFSGATREHWVEMGKLLLEGVFSHIPSMDTPMAFPKVPGKTYPNPETFPMGDEKTMWLEGLARTLNVAAPLIQENPDITINGIRLIDYYTQQLVATADRNSSSYVPTILEKGQDFYQAVCEYGGIAMNLLLAPALWENFSREQKELFAARLSDYAHETTRSHNWRYFNVMMLTFLKLHGFRIDETLLQAHHDNLLLHYGGDGWFNDQEYDYYSSWVFHLYGILWCRFYGDQHEPERVRVIERNFAEFMDSYARLFGRDGYMIMYGRSICYRLGAACPFPLTSWAKESSFSPGFARRLASGSMLQFLTREEFFMNRVPSLGFYGHFEPCLQAYSCSASPFWMFLNYSAAMSLPADAPFWTAQEEEGFWGTLGNETAAVALKGPGFTLTSYGKHGASELRPGKAKAADPNYSRLVYNTHFPWEDDDPAGGTPMTFNLSEIKRDNSQTPFEPITDICYDGMRDGILYRQCHFGKSYKHLYPHLDLAELFLPNGFIRCDRIRMSFPFVLTYGHFGLPHMGGNAAKIEKRTVGGHPVIIARIPGRQIAITLYNGWDELCAKTHKGFNAEAEESSVVYAKMKGGLNLPVTFLVMAMQFKRSDEAWTEEELNPLKSFSVEKYTSSGSLYGAQLRLQNGTHYTVDFGNIDGNRTH